METRDKQLPKPSSGAALGMTLIFTRDMQVCGCVASISELRGRFPATSPPMDDAGRKASPWS